MTLLSSTTEILLTCEHAANRVPRGYEALFVGHQRLLRSHRGYDIGALQLARSLARSLGAPLLASRVTRLLIDANRSERSLTLFSELSRRLASEDRATLVRRFHRPHRTRVEAEVRGRLARRLRVVHLAIHSFTPVLDGVRRDADVGLLYDPRARAEKQICLRLEQALRHAAPRLRLRRNYPYLGIADSLPTYLRKHFGGPRYCGIEIEVNQRFAHGDPSTWRSLRRVLADAVRAAVSEYPSAFRLMSRQASSARGS